MKRICVLFSALVFLGISNLSAQVSPDCGNAIPICNNTPVNGGTNGFGVDDFNGSLIRCNGVNSGWGETNSAWYRFRTGASGQLGFNLNVDSTEDWDFALYKSDGCSGLGVPVRCNFFDNRDGNSFVGVGEDPTGDWSNIQYEDWLEVEPGEDYYLIIDNFSNGNSGFSIQFSGNIFVTNPFDALDCSIVSNLLGPPISSCEGQNVTLNATTTNGDTYRWYEDTGSGLQLISGETSEVLVVSVSGTYLVEIETTFGNLIKSDVHVGFSPVPNAFTIADIAACSEETTFDLSTKDNEALGSQSPNDFTVSYHNTLADANSGANVLPKLLPIPSATKTIYVRVSSGENPDCYDASQRFQLIRLETPVLDFPSEVYLCDGDSSVSVGSMIARPFYSYSWDSGETTPSIDVAQEGIYTVTVTNTQNGVSCSLSKPVAVIVSDPPIISNVEIEDLQEKNTVTVFTQEEGDWEYRLDNGPYQSSPTFKDVLAGMHTVTVNDNRGCGSVTEQIVVVGFPKFFTPNGDNMYDYWQITGISNLDNPIVSIYNRYGKLLTQLTRNSEGWDGTFAGKPLPSSDYWFKLTYKDTNGQITEAKYINNHFSLKR